MKSYLFSLMLVFSLSAQAEIPTDSIFNSQIQLQFENGENHSLSELSGKTLVVAFVYTHCTSTCPTVVADIKKLEQTLSTKARNNTQFLLISLDPERDSATERKNFMHLHKIDNPRWYFANSNINDTRELALLMNIRYRVQSDEVIHSNLISILDKQGRILWQGPLGKNQKEAVDAITTSY